MELFEIGMARLRRCARVHQFSTVPGAEAPAVPLLPEAVARVAMGMAIAQLRSNWLNSSNALWSNSARRLVEPQRLRFLGEYEGM